MQWERAITLGPERQDAMRLAHLASFGVLGMQFRCRDVNQELPNFRPILALSKTPPTKKGGVEVNRARFLPQPLPPPPPAGRDAMPKP